MPKPPTPPAPRYRVEEARVKLMLAIERYTAMVGRAQWLNGYRAGNPAKEAELFAEEQRRWGYVPDIATQVKSALSAYRRALNASLKKGHRTP